MLMDYNADNAMNSVELKKLFKSLYANCTEKCVKSNINKSRTIKIDARKFNASKTNALNG